MIPRREKLYLTLLELSNLAASESSATWEIFQDKLDGEKELLFKLSKIKEEIELLPGTRREFKVLTKLEKHLTLKKSTQLDPNSLNTDIDFYLNKKKIDS